jgi:hypothetical protein
MQEHKRFEEARALEIQAVVAALKAIARKQQNKFLQRLQYPE